MTELERAIDYSRPTITKTVDCLAKNDLVKEKRDGTRRLVRINQNRVNIPDNPYLEIPQSEEFYTPVKSATTKLLAELDTVIVILLYGSVARGEADRQSDIDLWVLVEEDRMGNQREANQIRKDLEDTVFNGNRYDFEIDVESLQAVPPYVNDLQEIFRDSITLYQTDEFDTVRNIVLHGDGDE